MGVCSATSTMRVWCGAWCVQCYQYHESYLWGQLLPAALAATVFYVVGIPLLFAFLLYSIRKNKNGNGPTMLMGGLYSRYDHMWYAHNFIHTFAFVIAFYSL